MVGVGGLRTVLLLPPLAFGGRFSTSLRKEDRIYLLEFLTTPNLICGPADKDEIDLPPPSPPVEFAGVVPPPPPPSSAHVVQLFRLDAALDLLDDRSVSEMKKVGVDEREGISFLVLVCWKVWRGGGEEVRSFVS